MISSLTNLGDFYFNLNIKKRLRVRVSRRLETSREERTTSQGKSFKRNKKVMNKTRVMGPSFQGTVHLISSGSQLKSFHVRFTRVPLSPFYRDKNEEGVVILSV